MTKTWQKRVDTMPSKMKEEILFIVLSLYFVCLDTISSLLDDIRDGIESEKEK
ncbi:MAG: hypothetical protein WC606_01870 [Candidatus Absconditabacterales bacterium]|jgi:hypothetical protein